MILNSKLITIKRLLQNIRQFHCSLRNNAYEGSGKTTLTILNLEVGPKILIQKCTPMGFRFVDGSVMVGPLAIFPRTVLCWNIKSGQDINEKTLSLFTVLEPKLDIVVLGLETNYKYSRIIEMKRPLIEKNINVEVLPVEQACGIYNFLTEEGRCAAAALIPPLPHETVGYKRLKAQMDNINKQKTIKA